MNYVKHILEFSRVKKSTVDHKVTCFYDDDDEKNTSVGELENGPNIHNQKCKKARLHPKIIFKIN